MSTKIKASLLASITKLKREEKQDLISFLRLQLLLEEDPPGKASCQQAVSEQDP